MLVSEEPYIEPTKLERLSLRDSNKKQWVNDKVLFSSFVYLILMFLFFFSKGFQTLVHGIPEFDKFETNYVEPHFYYSTT